MRAGGLIGHARSATAGDVLRAGVLRNAVRAEGAAERDRSIRALGLSVFWLQAIGDSLAELDLQSWLLGVFSRQTGRSLRDRT